MSFSPLQTSIIQVLLDWTSKCFQLLLWWAATRWVRANASKVLPPAFSGQCCKTITVFSLRYSGTPLHWYVARRHWIYCSIGLHFSQSLTVITNWWLDNLKVKKWQLVTTRGFVRSSGAYSHYIYIHNPQLLHSKTKSGFARVITNKPRHYCLCVVSQKRSSLLSVIKQSV